MMLILDSDIKVISWGGCFNRLVNLSILFISSNSRCYKSNTIFGITEWCHSSDISVTWFSVGVLRERNMSMLGILVLMTLKIREQQLYNNNTFTL